MSLFFLNSDEGPPIPVRAWPPLAQSSSLGNESPRGHVVLVHGLGEHSGRHQELAVDLASHGWRVWAPDLPGHGLFNHAKGSWSKDCPPRQVIARVIEHIRSMETDAPLVLFGHSLGGLIAADYVREVSESTSVEHSMLPNLLCLSSPALHAELKFHQRLQLIIGMALVPSLAVSNGLDAKDVCTVSSVVEDYVDDPLVHDRVTPRVASWSFDAMDAVLVRASSWPIPTLLQWSAIDRCVAPEGSRRFALAAGPQRVTSHPWPTLGHEIFHDRLKKDVTQQLISWLEDQMTNVGRGRRMPSAVSEQ